MFQFQNNNNNAIVLELFINYLDDIIDEILLPQISFEANEESIESMELGMHRFTKVHFTNISFHKSSFHKSIISQN